MGIMNKLFVCFVINIAFLVLLVNANLQDYQEIKYLSDNIPVVGPFIFAGSYTDTTREWYTKVGAAVITVVGVNIVAILCWNFIRLGTKCCIHRRKCHWRKKTL